MPRIGILMFAPLSTASQAAFRAGLEGLGYIDGRNIRIEWRSANGIAERGPALARELVSLRVQVIVTEFTPMALAASQVTRTIPIVMAPAGDPVHTGLVASLAHPAGNITGFTNSAAELAGKRLELIHRAVPGLKRIGLLVQGGDPLDVSFVSETERAASAAKITLVVVKVPRDSDLDSAFSELKRSKVDAVLVPGNLPSPLPRVAQFAESARLPSISLFRQFPEAGGLMSYGASATDIQRRAAAHVDKLLRGARPADLPIEGPTKFELVINRAVGKRLGLHLTAALLIQADEVLD
jgi:putative ABC transport system substrate-binding protein